jgi:protein ImuB
MFACLYAQDFPVQAACRLEPGLGESSSSQQAIAIVDGPANQLKVFALNATARAAGIQIGMTKLQVEACGKIFICKRSLTNEDATQACLLDCGRSFSPAVESTEAGIAILDLEGTQKLFGNLQNTAEQIVRRGAELGLALRVAIASNPDTAMYASRGYCGITVIPEGEEAGCLAALEIGILPATEEMLEVFQGWGIRTLQSLAELPAIALTERLGQEGLRLQILARGKTCRLLLPADAMGDLVEEYEFEDPVETLESLAFILNRLIQQLCLRLISRSLATIQMDLKLELESRQIHAGREKEYFERVWKLPVPIQDGRVLFRLACLDLEKSAFSAPIRKITVKVAPVRPRSVQHGLFTPSAPETEQLEITLSRIRGLVGCTDENGMACVGSPAVLDSHKPDSFTLLPFSSDLKPGAGLTGTSVSALRMFRPAFKIEVELAQGNPHCFWMQRRRLQIHAASGPWNVSGNWWSTSAWAREEWDVAVHSQGGACYYRLYLDKLQKQWFVEGIFD